MLHGLEKIRLTLIVFAPLFGLWPAAAKRVAIVVGNSAYLHFAPLPILRMMPKPSV